MTVLPAVRPRSRAAFDPRVVVGVLLVAGSVLGVVGLVAAQNRTTEVWVARDALVAGERITADHVARMPVRLGDTASRYLAGALPRGGLVVTRPVSAGELVPLSALGSAAAVNVASVVVTLSTAPSDDAVPGSIVDLWAAPKTSDSATTYGPPVVLVSGATVVRVMKPTGFVQSAGSTQVELQVPRDTVAAVLEAVADDSRIAAVTVGRPAR